MKGFFYGLTAGLTAGVVAQMMIAKNHEQMLELVRNIPRSTKFSNGSTLDELLMQRDKLEEMIIAKQQSESFEADQEEETSSDTESNSTSEASTEA